MVSRIWKFLPFTLWRRSSGRCCSTSETPPRDWTALATRRIFSSTECSERHSLRRLQTARRMRWPYAMHRASPRLGFRPPSRSWATSSITKRAISSAVETRLRRETCPVERHTNTVSTTEDVVPLIWMEAPISAGQGREAEQTRPASRRAMARGKYASAVLW